MGFLWMCMLANTTHYLNGLKHINLKIVNKYKYSYEFPSFDVEALSEIINTWLPSFNLVPCEM